MSNFQTDPAPMPTIQVGDVVMLGSSQGPRYDGPRSIMTEYDEGLFNGAGRSVVLAIYRYPLWRRPQAERTKGDE